MILTSIFFLFILVGCTTTNQPPMLNITKYPPDLIVGNLTADNITITPNGNLNGNFSAYAEGYFHSYTSPAVVGITVANKYYNISNYTLGEIYLFSPYGKGVYTNKSGLYAFTFMFAMQGGNGGDYELELFINETSQPDCATFISTSTTDHVNAVVSCLKILTVGDVLTVRVKDLSAPPQDIEYHQVNMRVVEVI